ncbi:MAG: AEC family transporter [Clostridia bacterium]|nr:AEC family transporter [Clostridia bacterium]
MEIFNLTLTQMLMMFSFMLCGFAARKTKIVPESAEFVLSRIETYIFCSGITLYSMINNCTVENFVQNSSLILYGGLTVLGALLIAYPLSILFQPDHKENAVAAYKRNIYKYALTFGNYGYIGNFLILGIFGSEALFYYSMFNMIPSLISTGWGIYVLVPKDENESLLKNMIKGLRTLPVISLFVGIILGFLNIKAYLPDFCLSLLEHCANCYGPTAMLLAGISIGGYNIKNLITEKKTYIVAFLRLILLPSIIVLIYKLFGIDDSITLNALIAFSTPMGLGLIVFPAAYGADTKVGASMVLVSSVLATITIPLMYLVHMVWF